MQLTNAWLEDRIRKLEDEVLRLKRGTSSAQSSGSSTTTVVNTSTGMTRSEVISIAQSLVVCMADIDVSAGGTSFNFSDAPARDSSGNPVAMLVLNGVVMRRGSTGPNGWTYSNPTGITTVTSLTAASDKLTAFYVLRTV